AAQDLPGRDGPPPHGGSPVAVAGGQVDLAEHGVDHSVEEVPLASDVVVERHRLDSERLAELAHAKRGDPAGVGEGDRGSEHPIAAQRRPVRSGMVGRSHVRLPLLTVTYAVSIFLLTA